MRLGQSRFQEGLLVEFILSASCASLTTVKGDFVKILQMAVREQPTH